MLFLVKIFIGVYTTVWYNVVQYSTLQLMDYNWMTAVKHSTVSKVKYSTV